MKINRTRERILDKSIELFNRKQASNVKYSADLYSAGNQSGKPVLLLHQQGRSDSLYLGRNGCCRRSMRSWKRQRGCRQSRSGELSKEIMAHYAKYRFFYTERTTLFYNDNEMEELYAETAAKEKDALEAVLNRWAGEGKAELDKDAAKILGGRQHDPAGSSGC